MVARLIIKNKTVMTTQLTWYYAIVLWKGSEEILSIYFLCLLSGLMLVQGSTLLLNTTDNDVWKA